MRSARCRSVPALAALAALVALVGANPAIPTMPQVAPGVNYLAVCTPLNLS